MGSLALMGAGPEAGGSFSPASVSGLAAWYSADAGTSTTTDGVAISQWNDQSGNARNLAQGTGANQPVYKAAIQNGLPVVRFNGSTHCMFTSAFAHTQQWSAFGVFKNTALSMPQGALSADNTAGVRVAQFLRYNTATAESIAFDTTPTPFTDTETATVTQFNTISAVRTGTTVQVWVNATSGGSTATTGTPQSGSEALAAGCASFSGTTPATLLAGDIGELIYYAAAVNSTDRQSIESYLKAKWGTP